MIRYLLADVACLAVSGMALVAQQRPQSVRHYVYFNTARERIAEPWFLASATFEGAQLKYRWPELEPERDRYDFSSIRHDLAVLRGGGKRLFIQLQDVSFDASIVNAPRYLLTEPEYHGGIAGQYARDADSTAKPGGYVARRWDPAVRHRFQKLLAALGREFDGQIEGITLPETSVEFGTSGALHPSGFTPAAYRDGILDNMRALRRSFPAAVAMQYANFMPGEWLPADDKGYLKSVYAAAREIKLGMGSPDLLPLRRGQQNHPYAMLRAYRGVAPTGIAVQWGNYEDVDSRTGARITVPELVDFATNTLGVHYIFWEPQEPFFSKDVLPFLHRAPPPPAASQNPSPMVEAARAHERLTPKNVGGVVRSFLGPEGRPVELWMPEAGRIGDAVDLVVHFHGAAWVPKQAAAELGTPVVAAVLNLGAGSGAYHRAFSDPTAFDSLLAGVAREVAAALGKAARIGRVTLVGFSAGHGAVRAILRDSRHFATVDAVLLLDGMQTSYVPDGTVLAAGGALDTTNLVAFAAFARAAVRGEKRFVVTHSEIFPGTFASTTETAGWLLRALGLRRTPVLRWGPRGMQQLSEVRAGGFELLGFAGNSAPDHIDHLHAMPELLARVRRETAADSLPVRYGPVGNVLPLRFGALRALELGRAFTHVGGQRFILGGTADAEQHLFVDADSNNSVRRLYWIQIEERLPTQGGSYNYSADSTLTIRELPLAVNIRTYANPPEPGSDRARAFGFVASHGYRVPDGATRVRLVYIPDPSARREIMIVYLEPSVVGVAGSRAALLSRATAGLTVHRMPD